MSKESIGARVALVTGAAGGIGQAICRSLQREGYYVFGADLAKALVKPGSGKEGASWNRPLALDVTSLSSWGSAVEQVERAFGSLDVLVNNAGVLIVGDVDETSLTDWTATLNVNLTGAFLGMKSCTPLLRSSRGAVVNVSSVVGLRGNERMVAYSASKAGLLGLTYASARDLARSGVRVNAVCPGTIATQMTESFLSTAADGEVALQTSIVKHPLGRLGSAYDVAAAVTYLASASANFITGIALPVDGGRSLG